MNRPGILLFLFILSIAVSCQKKDLVLELVETKCKKFKINQPLYSWVQDPSCGGTDTATFQVHFKHEGEPDCIDRIIVEPEFYEAGGNKISGVLYPDTISESKLVRVYEDSASFELTCVFPSSESADDLNHIYVKFHTENELGNKSSEEEVRINGWCSTVDTSSYNIKDSVEVSANYVDVRFWDDASEDQDVISVYLNGAWVLENYSLTNAGETFRLTVYPGNNHLILFAVNQGRSGPNTLALSVNGGEDINISPDLLKGEAINISF